MGIRGSTRVRKSLVEGREFAFLSRKLATVRTDVLMEMELDRFRWQRPSKEKLRELFTELGFTQLIKGLDADGSPGN